MSRILFIFSLFTTSCALSYEEIDRVEKVCSKVTNENWRNAAWGDRTSFDVCRETPAVHNEDFMLCSLGARPFFCQEHDDGHVIVYSVGGTYVDDIWPEDMERVAPHLVIHN